MVKHIILWKLKDEFNNGVVKDEMKKNLEALVGKIHGLIEMKIQIDNLESSNADVMLYSVFENKKALSDYAIHPEHVRVADEFVRPFTKTRLCIDFAVSK